MKILGRATLIMAAVRAAPSRDATWWPALAPLTPYERAGVLDVVHKGEFPL